MKLFNAAALKYSLAVIAVMGVLFISCTRTEKNSVVPPEKVTFAYTVLPDSALAQVATAKGYYLREGLAVTSQIHQIGKQTLQSVLDGKADFATVAETPVMFSIMRGDRISIIATINISNKNMAIVARKDMGISSLQDLKGKKVATTLGTIGEFFMDSMMIVNGISRQDLNVVNLPPEMLHDALSNGDVAAISAWNPILTRTQKKLGDGCVTFYGENIYTQTYNVVATQEYIRRYPGNVEKLLRSLIRAEEFIRKNPAEAQKIVANSSQTDKKSVEETWSANDFRVSLDQLVILVLEDETRWAIHSGMARASTIPNYLDFIYLDGLMTVKPQAVSILR